MPDDSDNIAEKAYMEIIADSEFHRENGMGHPRLLVMSGLPMSGKSHLSNIISERLDGKICVVRSDLFRPVVARAMGRAEPIYDRSEHALVFQVGERLVSNALQKGWCVISDATNLTEQNREWAVRPATEIGCPVMVAFLNVSIETALDRNKEKNRDGSAATPAVYAILNYEKEPIEKCRSPYIEINSEIDIRPWGDILAKWISGEIDSVPGAVMPRSSHEPETERQKYRKAAKEKARLRKLEVAGNSYQHVHGDVAEHE